MSAPSSVITATFIDSYNADIEAIGSASRVTLPPIERHDGMLALQDDEGTLLDFIPASSEL